MEQKAHVYRTLADREQKRRKKLNPHVHVHVHERMQWLRYGPGLVATSHFATTRINEQLISTIYMYMYITTKMTTNV